ncbi:MAG: hypothetical protein GX279_04980 [Clostridiaceae bacterium]|nr:hypothetical protein [Clostridiaceae bacterium]
MLADKIDKLALHMERSRIRDYICYLENPRKLLFPNFLAGIARGFGASVGFTLLTALLLYILQRVVKLELPIISEFIGDIVRIVENSIRKTGG